jgi:formamidopyrimidine-DNA glycosylase
MPTRKVKDISLSEWEQIVRSVQKILELGIKYGGTTDSDYVNADGEKGGMQNHLKVYHHTGERCQRNGCTGVVKRITLGGRGTHYCENCQK